MAFEITKQKYTGKVKELVLGSGDHTVKVGGENCYPFYTFEGEMPNPPVIAMEIWDHKPEDWAPACLKPFEDVADNAAAWAKKCVEKYGAEIIVLQLKSIDPNGMDKSADDVAPIAKSVIDAVDVPVIIWGVASHDKDTEVLKKISELCDGKNIVIGPVEEGDHKALGAAALAYKHTVGSSSPIDVNLAKQLNILLGNLGVQDDKLIIDPTTGGLGYGMEYSYSVMERIRMASLIQGDDKLQNPIINNLGNEIWKCKEAKQSLEEAPELGDPEKRGILMEAIGAVAMLLAGSNVLIMRHPEAIKLVKEFMKNLL